MLSFIYLLFNIVIGPGQTQRHQEEDKAGARVAPVGQFDPPTIVDAVAACTCQLHVLRCHIALLAQPTTLATSQCKMLSRLRTALVQQQQKQTSRE